MSSDQYGPPFSWQLPADSDRQWNSGRLFDNWDDEFDLFNNEPFPTTLPSTDDNISSWDRPRDWPFNRASGLSTGSDLQPLSNLNGIRWLPQEYEQDYGAFGGLSSRQLPPPRGTPMLPTETLSSFVDDSPSVPNPPTSRTPLPRLAELPATGQSNRQLHMQAQPLPQPPAEPAVPEEPHPAETYGNDWADFLNAHPLGAGCILFHNDSGELETIKGLNMDVIGERCALLAAAFEYSRSGPQFFLEIATSISARPFCRFLYNGTYATAGVSQDDIYAAVPTSLLLHCQLYRLGDVYDLADLKTQAYVNVLRQCEFGCSSPEKPIDLCKAIEYVYEHLRSQDNLIDAVLNYCASCFLRHDLANDADFKSLAYNLRPFQQDLCKIAMERPIEESDIASAIIQMPFRHVTANEMSGLSNARGAALLGEAVALALNENEALDQDAEFSPKKRKRAEAQHLNKAEAGPSRIEESDAVPERLQIAESGTLPLRLRSLTISSPDGATKSKRSSDQRRDKGTVRKRRASAKKNQSSPIAVPIEEESDYEVISGPDSVVALSDSESDAGSAAEEITHEDLSFSQRTIRALPLRTRSEIPAIEKDADGNDDSDWTLF